MASESKKSFSPMLIYCNGIIFHLGFKDSGFSPPLIHLGNIKNFDFCPVCPPPQILVWMSSPSVKHVLEVLEWFCMLTLKNTLLHLGFGF